MTDNTPDSARHLFIDRFKGQANVFTRGIVRFGWVAAGRHAYEISQGKGIMGGTIYGVTILDADGTHRTDLGELVHSLEEVETKLQSIREIYR